MMTAGAHGWQERRRTTICYWNTKQDDGLEPIARQVPCTMFYNDTEDNFESKGQNRQSTSTKLYDLCIRIYLDIYIYIFIYYAFIGVAKTLSRHCEVLDSTPCLRNRLPSQLYSQYIYIYIYKYVYIYICI